MIKKLLNPLVVSAFILIMLLGSLAHLIYGSCQSSKWHYIIQHYYMTEYLPNYMLNKNDKVLTYPFSVYVNKDYSGVWRSWTVEGMLKIKANYKNGANHGEFSAWYDNGKRHYKANLVNGEKHGKLFWWMRDGSSYCIQQWEFGVPISSFVYNKDGALNKKEYYNEKGNFQRRELFENNKPIKTETQE